MPRPAKFSKRQTNLPKSDYTYYPLDSEGDAYRSVDKALVDKVLAEQLKKKTIPALFIEKVRNIPHWVDNVYNYPAPSKFVYYKSGSHRTEKIHLGTIVYPWTIQLAYIVLGDVDVGFGFFPGKVLAEERILGTPTPKRK